MPGWTPSKAKPNPAGNFLNAGTISETITLGARALYRTKGDHDATTLNITDITNADKYLTRECRSGWEL